MVALVLRDLQRQRDDVIVLQKLQLCVERLPGVWCDAFAIDSDGVLALTVEKDGVTCSLIASVKQLTNLQRQVPTKYDVTFWRLVH